MASDSHPAQSDVTQAMIDRATEAVVATHDDELRAYLAGEIAANVWRPERYAEAALKAALTEESS